MDNFDTRLRLSLLTLRLGVAAVMFPWTILKFVNPTTTASIFERFYYLAGISTEVAYALGAIELIVIIGFVIGFQKRITYGAVFVLHGISTLASYMKYIDPYEGSNLLFFAAWPMLAACFTLYILRDFDTLWTVPPSRKAVQD